MVRCVSVTCQSYPSCAANAGERGPARYPENAARLVTRELISKPTEAPVAG
jgi:hypothetical protein